MAGFTPRIVKGNFIFPCPYTGMHSLPFSLWLNNAYRNRKIDRLDIFHTLFLVLEVSSFTVAAYILARKDPSASPDRRGAVPLTSQPLGF